MATYSQYISTNGTSGTPSTQFVNIALSEASPMDDDYIILQTGQYRYVAVIGNYSDGVFKNCDIVTLDRTNSAYDISRSTASSVTVSVSNEYYVYSSIGMGQFVSYPRTDYYVCIAVCITCVFTVMAVALRNLFPKWGWRRET